MKGRGANVHPHCVMRPSVLCTDAEGGERSEMVGELIAKFPRQWEFVFTKEIHSDSKDVCFQFRPLFGDY